MMPRVHPGDNTRIGRAPPVVKDKICHHKFEECRCYDGDIRCYLFTHSAYYLEPLALWKTLMEDNVRDAIVVEHVFDDIYGGFYNEASWSVERTVVTMRVNGNGHPYVHTLPPWQCEWIGEDGESFSYEVLKELDNVTRVIRIEPCYRRERIGKALTWMEVEANPHISGPVQFSSAVKAAVADNARFTGVSLDIHKIHKFGPVLYTDYILRGETVSVTVPVNAVSQAAALAVNRARDAPLYQEMTHVMRNRLARSRIPPSKLPSVLATVVALGFVVNLNNETDLAYSMLNKFSWLIKAHSVLLQFGEVGVRRWPWFLALVVFATVWVVPLEILENDDTTRIVVALSAVVFVLLGVAVIKGCLGLGRKVQEYRTSMWVSSLGSEDGPTAPLLGHSTPIRANLPIPGSRYIRPVPDNLQGSMTLGATREKAQEPNRSLVSGVVVDGVMPTVLATTQDAEASAVGNRILVDKTNPDAVSLARYGHTFTSSIFAAVQCSIDMSKPAFNRWLKKIADSYPATYVENMRQIWDHYQGAVPPPVATKGFLKVEKSAATIQVDGGKKTKPRLIQPPEDIDKAMTGYVVVQLYEAIRDAWDGFKTKVLYCSGRSARYIGERVDDFLQRHPNAVGVSLDMATFDATLCYEKQKKCFDWYVSLGVPEWWIKWLVRVRTRGVTPNGVKYEATREYAFETVEEAKEVATIWRKRQFKVKGPVEKIVELEGNQELMFVIEVEDFQMTSGRMDTNLTDTVALVASFAPIFALSDYLLLVCGDDAFLMIPPDCTAVLAFVEKFQRSLGFKPESVATTERSKWEFCSKLFWYGRENPDGPDFTVLGSKPFRGISRMGLNTTLPGAANAAQAALSVRIDSGHVPFLAPMADRTYELCAQQKIKPRGRVEWTAIRGDKRYHCSPLNYIITQERYNLGKENEDEFKSLLASLQTVPIVLSYPPALDAVRRDEE
jgi:hypothetical protein